MALTDKEIKLILTTIKKGKGIEETKKALAKMTKGTKKSTDQMKLLKGAMTSVFGAVGVAMILRFAGQAIKKFAEFDRAMRNVNAIAQVSEEQFIKMTDAVLELSTIVPQTATILAAGLYDIQSASFVGADALEILRVSAIGATAGITDTKIASEVLVKTLNAYNLPASDAADVMDTLFKTVEKGLITFPELSVSLSKAVAVASTADVPFDEVAAAMATMTKTGLDAQLAGTALFNLLNKILGPTPQAEAAFKKLGIAYGASALQAKGLSGVMAEIVEKTGGEITALRALFPDRRAFIGVSKLMTAEGKVFAQALDDIAVKQNRAGATTNAFNQQAKSLDFQLQLLNSATEKLTILIVKEFAPALTGVIQILIKGVEWIDKIKKATEKFDEENKGLVKILEKANKFLTDMRDKLVNLFMPIGQVTKLFNKLGGMIDKYIEKTEESTEVIDEEAKAAVKAARATELAADKKIAAVKAAAKAAVTADEKAEKKREKIILRFQQAFNKATQEQAEFNVTKLNEQKEEYEKYNIDKNELDQWYQAELDKIQAKEAEKHIKLLSEKAGRDDAYFLELLRKEQESTTAKSQEWKTYEDEIKKTQQIIQTKNKEMIEDIVSKHTFDLVDGIRTGNKSIENVFDNLVQDIIMTWEKMIADMIAKWAASQLMSGLNIGISGGGGGGISGAVSGAARGAAIGSVIPIVGNIVGGVIGGIAGLFGFAEGGIVTKPTMGLLGEAGAEAIIPLDKMGSMGDTIININAQTFMGDKTTARMFAKMVDKELQYLDRTGQRVSV